MATNAEDDKKGEYELLEHGGGGDSQGPGVIIATPGGGTARLNPLPGQKMDSPSRKPLPPIDVERASAAARVHAPAGDTIISVPEGGAGAFGVGRGDRSSEGPRGRAIETIIYTMDKAGLQFTVEDGQTKQAGEMFEYVMEELDLPESARQVFSLWLVSDLLELQLRPNHTPFKLACYWDELLEKYTDAPEEDIQRDEPILMFQRNVFLKREDERKIHETEILRLLYHEAKENIVDARYPLKEEELDRMAGIQAHIEHEGYRGSDHTPHFYKNKLDQYYPAYIAKKKSSWFSSKDRVEDRLAGWHRAASKKLQGKPITDAYKMYLQSCWKLPYYGGAFFRGQIEHPGTALVRSVKDDPVFIAINTDGVFVIDMDDSIFLLGLLYQDFSWQYAEPCDATNRDCYPCLFLQFPEKEKGQDVTKVLQVFSREGALMDALIETCVGLKTQTPTGEDSVDGALDDDGDGIIKSDASTWKEFNRLSLATYKGEQCIKSNLKKPQTKRKK